MGCAPSRLEVGEEEQNEEQSKTSSNPARRVLDARFRGFRPSDAYLARTLAHLDRMDALRLPYLTRRGLLLGFARTRTWSIYLQFSDWPMPVTAALVDRLVTQFRRACALWLQHLLGYEGFPNAGPDVRVFGFVFRKGVVLDPSFLAKYGKHPVVTDWTERGEASPWTLAHEDGRAFTPQNFYRSDLDLSRLRVTGNRTGTGATYNTPTDWTASAYVHPEGLTGFQTRYWHGAKEWHAFAQQHYLRVGGVVINTRTGDFAERFHVLQHEMGHCFFLDDMYDTSKYPQPLPSCSCQLDPGDTIMYRAKALTSFDHAMLRHVWLCQKERYVR